MVILCLCLLWFLLSNACATLALAVRLAVSGNLGARAVVVLALLLPPSLPLLLPPAVALSAAVLLSFWCTFEELRLVRADGLAGTGAAPAAAAVGEGVGLRVMVPGGYSDDGADSSNRERPSFLL